MLQNLKLSGAAAKNKNRSFAPLTPLRGAPSCSAEDDKSRVGRGSGTSAEDDNLYVGECLVGFATILCVSQKAQLRLVA